MNKKDSIKLIDDFLSRSFKLNRSLTGNANKQTLEILKDICPISIGTFKSHTSVFDWKVPAEWNVKQAFIESLDGKRILDFSNNNLHLVSNSINVKKIMAFRELKEKLHFIKEKPNLIPYRTSYYKKDWGFCLTYKQYQKLALKPDALYKVVIDSEFKKGVMHYGELVIRGKSSKEILLSTYICHPSMANDNLSGMIATAMIAKELISKKNLNYTYRFIWVPETIGAIAYTHKNLKKMQNIDFGFVVTCCGGRDQLSFKESIDNYHFINKLTKNVLKKYTKNPIVYPFDIRGSDERQFSSIGLNINTVSIFKSKYYEYPQYHTSGDDLNFVKASAIQESIEAYLEILTLVENQDFYESNLMYCEPMLSKRKLYDLGGASEFKSARNLNITDIILWLVKLCDGKTPISLISERLSIDELELKRLADRLVVLKLLKKK